MKFPIYCDTNLRLLPSSSYAHLLGDDDLRWPKSFWIKHDGDKGDRAYFLVNQAMYAFLIWQVRHWKEGVKTGRYDKNNLKKSLARYDKIQSLVSESFSDGEMNYARYLAKNKPAAPVLPPKVPSISIDMEAQSLVYFTHYKTAPFLGEYPSVLVKRLPPEIWRLPEFKKFLKKERISEFVAILAFDSYFDSNLGKDLRLSVLFIEEMLRKKYEIPRDVLNEHKVRKFYLDRYMAGNRSSAMPNHHQSVMNGFKVKKKSVIIQRSLWAQKNARK